MLKQLEASIWARLALVGIGFLPIAALALALGGLFPLKLATLIGVLPIWFAAIALASRRPGLIRALGLTVVVGMAATLCYDAARLTMSFASGIPDGIPNIGRLLLSDMNAETADVFGLAYTYRYLGDGGGLALAYAMGRRYSVASGMLFGAAICGCLWITLWVVPVAQALLFPLNALGMTITLTGHLVFGGVLGGLMQRVFPATGRANPVLVLSVKAAGFESEPLKVR